MHIGIGSDVFLSWNWGVFTVCKMSLQRLTSARGSSAASVEHFVFVATASDQGYWMDLPGAVP